MSLSKEDQEINQALDYIIKPENGSKEIQKGINKMNDILNQNDEFDILKIYNNFFDSANELKNNPAKSCHPNDQIRINKIVELNEMLKRIHYK